MKLFNFFEKRNKDIPKDNPCHEEQQAFSLSNLLRKQGGDAMNLSAFFCGVNIISNSIAVMKWIFKDIDNNELPFQHYLNHVFDNSTLTRFNIIKNVITDLILYGNSFIYIKRNEFTGEPITLEYSPAKETSMYWNPINYTMYFLNPKFSQVWDNGENYLHFFSNTNNGFQGVAIKEYAYKVISLANETEKSAKDYYSSGGTLHGLISINGSTPAVGTREKQINSLKASWDEARRASQGTGTIFVPEDLKYTPLASNAKDSALVESREFNITEIARYLNINPILLGDLRHNVYGTLSEAQKDLILHTLKPYVIMIEEEVNRKIIMPSKFGKEHLDIDENSIQSIDRNKQLEELSKAVTQGIMTQNEARKELGLSPVEGGDKLIIAYSKVEDNNTNKENGGPDNNSDSDNNDKSGEGKINNDKDE